MDDIHPLVLKVAGKLVPMAIGGMAADVKFLFSCATLRSVEAGSIL